MIVKLGTEKEQVMLRAEISSDDKWEEAETFFESFGRLVVLWHPTKKEVVCEIRGGILEGEIFKPKFSNPPRNRLHAIGLTLLYISSSIPVLLFV
jgi:hypothetical protein